MFRVESYTYNVRISLKSNPQRDMSLIILNMPDGPPKS